MISQGFKEVDAKSEFKYVNLDLVKLVFHAVRLIKASGDTTEMGKLG